MHAQLQPVPGFENQSRYKICSMLMGLVKSQGITDWEYNWTLNCISSTWLLICNTSAFRLLVVLPVYYSLPLR